MVAGFGKNLLGPHRILKGTAQKSDNDCRLLFKVYDNKKSSQMKAPGLITGRLQNTLFNF